MTDNEIIKAWEKILATGDAPIGEHWSVGAVVTTKLAKATFDMLNRQKAEVKSKEIIIERLRECVDEAYADGVKELAERVEEELRQNTDNNGDINSCLVPNIIGNLVKEMVGE